MASPPETSVPPYTENDTANDHFALRDSQSHDNQESPPPPYESSSDPAAAARASGNKTEKPTSSPLSTAEAAGSSSSKSSFSFRQLVNSYEEKKKAKKAAELVNFYESEYGFVPKNVMSKAEWEKARENAPKEKVTRFKTNVFNGRWD